MNAFQLLFAQLLTRSLCALALFAMASDAFAQNATKPTYDQKKLRSYFEESAQKYKITTQSGELLQRRQQASLIMHNDEGLQNLSGSVYIWEKKNNRPAAIVMIFIYWYDGRYHWRHELVSVCDEALVAEYDGEEAWMPTDKALNFTVVKDIAPPAATPALRLTQMRQIARDFSGDLNITGQPTIHLRLMPTPIHRYEIASEGVIDGALFSLAIETDFEILLALEAHKLKDGSMTWNWAPARGHYHELILQHKDSVVWKVPRYVDLEQTLPGQMPYAAMHYFLFTPETRLPSPEDLK